MIKPFVLGLITGATATWVLRDSLAGRIDSRTRTIRAATAHRLRATADAIERGVASGGAADTPARIARAS